MRDPYEELLDELVGAIELRECGDPDAQPWGVENRIRRLERQLLEQHRHRPGRLHPPAAFESHRGVARPVA